MSKSTMKELVVELEKIEEYPEINEMIKDAKAGAYHDFKSEKYSSPKSALIRFLTLIADNHPSQYDKIIKIRKAVMKGDYDERPDAGDLKALTSNIYQDKK